MIRIVVMMQVVACLFAATGVAQEINLDPISANTNHQEDSHGIRLFDEGQYALVADRRGDAVLCFDVSDPADMRFVSKVSDQRTEGAHYVTIGPEERYAYTGAVGHFTVIDITDPENLTIHGSVKANEQFSQDIVVAEDNTIAYWASTGIHTLYAVEVTDKSAPRVLGSMSGVGPPNFLESVAHLELSPDDSLLFATSYRDHHLLTFDVSERGRFERLDATGDSLVSPHEMEYYKGYLYVGTMYDNDAENPREDGALTVFDVSDPADIRFVTELRMGPTYPANQYPFDMLHGLTLDPDRKLLFGASQKNNGTTCTDKNSALSVFDVSDPASPTWVQSYQSCEWLNGAQEVVFRDGILYTVNHDVPSIASFRLYGDPESGAGNE